MIEDPIMWWQFGAGVFGGLMIGATLGWVAALKMVDREVKELDRDGTEH